MSENMKENFLCTHFQLPKSIFFHPYISSRTGEVQIRNLLKFHEFVYPPPPWKLVSNLLNIFLKWVNIVFITVNCTKALKNAIAAIISVRMNESAFSIYHSWICASSSNEIAISVIKLLFCMMQLAMDSFDLSERREYTWYRARYCLCW